MKLTCDLCGGVLQMNAGAQDVSCKNCGLCYSLEILREKLRSGGVTQPKATEPLQPTTPVVEPVVTATQSKVTEPLPPTPPVEEPVVTATAQQTVGTQPQLKPVAPVAEQFIMPVDTLFAACLTGHVQQGCIGVGEQVYIDGDYSTPYRLYRFGDNASTTHASTGKHAMLYLVPNRKNVLKKARMITGDPTPTANAYRFSGSVDGYFADLLQTNFAEYTLQKQVEWPGLKIPVNFMLLKNGRPVVAIFVFDSHDARSRYQAQKAAKLFGDAVIGCTHFYKDYRNDAPYVVDRIRAALG